jgi:NADPH-dependent curcumin reductase CurA
MRNDINRRWILARRPDGMVGEDDFTLVEGQIPVPTDGEVLVRNL